MGGIEPIDSSVGAVTWHSSETGAGPDVGISIGLGEGKMLYAGEISRNLHALGGEAVAALGGDGGWWLVIWPEGDVIARFASREMALALMETLEAVFVP